MSSKKPVRRGDEIKVGDRVLYHLPYGTWKAVVIEDRGHIGVNGRRILRILTHDEVEDARIDFEVPAEHLSRAD